MTTSLLSSKRTTKIDPNAILEKEDRPQREVDVPEWGVTLLLRGMHGAEYDAWRREYTVYDPDGTPQISANNTFVTIDDNYPARSWARLLVRCAYNQDGTLVFGPEHIEALAAKNRSVLKWLSDICMELSFITPRDEVATLGNSTAQNDALLSD